MTIISARQLICLTLFTLSCLSLPTVFAKEDRGTKNQEPRFYSQVPWSVGFWMEGTVTNVVLNNDRIHFQLTGRFWLSQFPPESPKPVTIEVHGKDGMSAIVSQAKPFFAMTSDWSGGALREDGKLFKILKTAAEHSRVVKFELTQPKMDFGPGQSFSLTHATVIRATDADLE